MSRRNLPTALAGLTLAATLAAAPPSAAAQEGGIPASSLPGQVWQWFLEALGSGEQQDISLQIDPNGLTAWPEETDGGGPTGEISFQIDPNG